MKCLPDEKKIIICIILDRGLIINWQKSCRHLDVFMGSNSYYYRKNRQSYKLIDSKLQKISICFILGVLGLQNTGKSTILNILAKNSPEEDEIFRVQSFEHQVIFLCVIFGLKKKRENTVFLSKSILSNYGMISFWVTNCCLM